MKAGDLGAVDFRKVGMEAWLGSVWFGQAALQVCLPPLQFLQLPLEARRPQAVGDGVVQAAQAAADLGMVALHQHPSGFGLGPHLVGLGDEGGRELLNQLWGHQPGFQSVQN
ncbi:hypothetical protein [Paramagnetospirillum kuznetsovii]|uniref:hypothetical protein n=1 Tax=Paramagnetospirillum kuznetsovii TaxID=2053833 RepID=UPI001EFE2706|nr:hypothetical protein [Paramagnetospirillum kuznetsovii]